MRKVAIFLMAMVAAGIISSCKDDEKGEAYGYDATRFTGEAPAVVSTIPSINEQDVDTLKQIVVTYDKNIFIPPHVSIKVNNEWVDSGVVAKGNQLIIPYELKGNTTYTVEIMRPSVRDELYDFALDFKFSFTTMLVNAFKPNLFQIAEAPVNPNATPEAVALYNYLKENFGKKSLTAAIANVNWNTENAEALYQITGKYPAINTFDYIHFNHSAPLHAEGWIDYTNTQVVEDWVDNGGIVSCMWHWMVPPSQADINNFNSYVINPDETEMTAQTATRTSGWAHEVAIRDIDIIADYLLQLQQKGIPVLWRPLHEARGNYGKYNGSGKAWFWWGGKGPLQFKKLWMMMFDRFKEKGVNNVLWVWTSEGTDPNDPSAGDDSDWYPGDDYVDIISRDYYFNDKTNDYHSALVDQFETLRQITGGKKLIAFSEGDAMPSVNNMLSTGAMWSWCMPWYGQNGSGVPYIDSPINTSDFLRELYASPIIITRDQVPTFK